MGGGVRESKGSWGHSGKNIPKERNESMIYKQS